MNCDSANATRHADRNAAEEDSEMPGRLSFWAEPRISLQFMSEIREILRYAQNDKSGLAARNSEIAGKRIEFRATDAGLKIAPREH